MKNRVVIFLTIILQLLLIGFIVTLFLFEKSTIKNFAIEQMNKKTTEKMLFFKKYIEDKEDLVLALANNYKFRDFVKNGENKEFIESLFRTFAHSHKNVFQLRFLDINGNEVIRVNNNKEPILVSKNKLQNKKGRYYFEDSFKLQNGEIYFSNIDLNVEKGKIEDPIVPTLRVATPVFIDDKKYGIVILNINVKEFLKSLEKTELYEINLVYDDGHIIFNKYKEFDWSRDFNHTQRIFDSYPFLEKVLETKTLENYTIVELPIKTKNKLFILIVPIEENGINIFLSYLEDKLFYLIVLSLLILPTSYLISLYIEKIVLQKRKLERTILDNELINAVINSTDDLIFYKDKNFKYMGCNRAFENFVGLRKDQIIGKTDYDIFDNEHASLFRRMDVEMLEKGNIKSNDEWVTYSSGQEVLLQTKKMPFNYSPENVFGIIGISRDVTEIHLAHKRIIKESYIDELTQVYNRKAFNERIVSEINLFNRYNTSFCMAMYDLDDFKNVNDTYGHDIGDMVLKEISSFVNTNIRKTDRLFRIGGEEFVIIFASTNLEPAYIVVEKIRKEIEKLDLIDNEKITISLGLAEVLNRDDAESIYKRVDDLLYKSKKEGKNRTSI